MTAPEADVTPTDPTPDTSSSPTSLTGDQVAAEQVTPTSTPVRAGRPPAASPAAGWVAVVAALLLLVAGIIALRDAAVGFGWLDGSSWIDTAAGWLDNRVHQTWMAIVAIPVAIVGLVIIVIALRGRARTAAPVSELTWIPFDDVARVSSTAARTVAGVVDARSTATPGRLVVRVESLNREVAEPVRDAVSAAIADWVYTPKVDVRTTLRGDRA